MPISRNKIKYITSLKEKKIRRESGTFVAEGAKLVLELSKTCKCQLIIALPEVLKQNSRIVAEEIIEASEADLKRITFLKTAPPIIGVFYQNHSVHSKVDFSNTLNIVLDGIQNPGNMGTIIRLADWFGIEHVFCSLDTSDCYNPKTVQATMGAIARVNIYYTDLIELLSQNPTVPAYGTFLEGDNIYNKTLSANGFIIMGKEGSGVSLALSKLITEKLFIPSFPADRETSESLNVASAMAIVCSEFRRR